MKKIIFLLLLTIPVAGYAQSGLLNKFKQKVKDRAEQRADEGMDKALDKAEEGVKKGGASGKQSEEKKDETLSGAESKSSSATTSFASYSRYDFIPGDNIVYAEDFSQDVVGEFPLKWAANNRGETVSVQGMETKWLRMYQNGIFLSPYLKTLPENFTAEFDLILHYTDKELDYIFPEITLGLLNSPGNDERGKNFYDSQGGLSDLKITIAPSGGNLSSIFITSSKDNMETFSNPPRALAKLGENYGKPVHFAIWIQKERLRLWMNGEKVYDIPQAVPENAAFNRMAIMVASSNYNEENVGYYISNIKFAQGAPDMRSKLITEGKFVTTGILFDVNSDKIKPESTGVLQEIAKVLKENASVKVKIIGHTDSDGEDAKNLDLSRRRAASVKHALGSQFGIEASRIDTDGKGESQPLSDNSSREGKAKNRRVEFVKM